MMMTLHTAHSKITTDNCTLNTVHCTLNTEHCKLHTAYYKLHTLQRTLDIEFPTVHSSSCPLCCNPASGGSPSSLVVTDVPWH